MEKLSSTEMQSVNYESNFSRLLLISAEPAKLQGSGKLSPSAVTSSRIIKLTNPLATRRTISFIESEKVWTLSNPFENKRKNRWEDDTGYGQRIKRGFKVMIPGLKRREWITAGSSKIKVFRRGKGDPPRRRRRTDRKQLVVGQEWSDASFERSRNDIRDDKRESLFEGDSWNSTMNLNYFNKTWPTSPARVCIYVWAFAHCQISMVKIKPPRKF